MEELYLWLDTISFMQYWLSFNEWNINNLFIIYYYESAWRHIVEMRILES